MIDDNFNLEWIRRHFVENIWNKNFKCSETGPTGITGPTGYTGSTGII
jgi:hypothetical protein